MIQIFKELQSLRKIVSFFLLSLQQLQNISLLNIHYGPLSFSSANLSNFIFLISIYFYILDKLFTLIEVILSPSYLFFPNLCYLYSCRILTHTALFFVGSSYSQIHFSCWSTMASHMANTFCYSLPSDISVDSALEVESLTSYQMIFPEFLHVTNHLFLGVIID